MSAGIRGASEPSPSEPIIQPLLLLLADCLVDDSVLVIKTAQYILRRVLSRQPAQQARQKLPQAVAEQLEPFAGLPEPPAASQHARNQSPKFQLDNADLWEPQGKSHETWVCHLTWTLLQHVSDPVLRDCHTAAYHKAPLAELLLPYVFGQLALDGSTDMTLFMKISEQLSRCVASPCFAAVQPAHAG